MKFTLKDYQEEAVKDVLINIHKAKKRWMEDKDKHSFSLTAATGSGKTVMAASIFETLFYGDDENIFQPDPGAVVIWLSDDPSLNEQSRYRIYESSDRLKLSDLIVVENSFNHEKFKPGNIYFLNTQKLSKKSILARGYIENDDNLSQISLMPDLRSYSIWDTISNTVEDPDLTLYLLLDEAHRGMSISTSTHQKNKPTIVRKLINGDKKIPGIPIVIGISATVERFNNAMSEMTNRSTLPNIEVDTVKVQESGLLKDTIVLDVPDEEGDFDTVLLRRGTDKLKNKSYEWSNYCLDQKDLDEVIPLMVFQVRNNPDPNNIALAIDTIIERWSDLSVDNIAHVFGEHNTQNFGKYSIPYISPERVQDDKSIKILIAKDAISSGWDCPRAEVMVSFRSANDKTHITQLLGRMVRTPLARRIPGYDNLNSVDCLLPYFNKKNVDDVVKILMTGGESNEIIPGRRVLINPQPFYPNKNITETIWQKFENIPTLFKVKKYSNPIKQLTLFAHELAADNLIKNAGKLSHRELHKVMDAARIRYENEILENRNNILRVEGKSIKADLGTQKFYFESFEESSDQYVIEDAFQRASRNLSHDLAKSYSENIVNKINKKLDIEELYIESHLIIASFGTIDEVVETIKYEAQKIIKKWFDEQRVAIKNLSDERKEVYKNIIEMSNQPIELNLSKPKIWMQPTVIKNELGQEKLLPIFKKHIMSNDKELFSCELNHFETEVVNRELNRKNFIAWYRNPPYSHSESLGISYELDGETKILHPDFLFFSKLDSGELVVDIVDPHGIHLNDAVPKLIGLAKYAKKFGNNFRRIDALTKINDEIKVLDLQNNSIREKIFESKSAQELFDSDFSNKYI